MLVEVENRRYFCTLTRCTSAILVFIGSEFSNLSSLQREEWENAPACQISRLSRNLCVSFHQLLGGEMPIYTLKID